MGFLGWIVAPALAADPSRPGFERLAVLTGGLIWQFGVVAYFLRNETGTLKWDRWRLVFSFSVPFFKDYADRLLNNRDRGK